ncbi:MAG: U32 family peptidase [Candidatus Brocadiaceae bacterium]|nr:U32 family peptidase [Candidatus Brocadiaceae bacterium]
MSQSPSHKEKPELLSPAGTMECFFAAIENGADAVYFGLKHFSARAGAQNFTLEEASRAIAYAHERSVNVYIALNTLCKTRELARITNYLVELEDLQPDALIIQDLGLLHLIETQFSDFQLHASTQMAIHNLSGAIQLKEMGFQRVVLARELSIDEIRKITLSAPLEIEVFIHGALCYSYSGLCLFSSMMGGRSANRGLCAQPCRKFYTTQEGHEGHLFSMKDLQTLLYGKELINAGIHSLKIEGRMKSSTYVAVVTNAYRMAIDGKLDDPEEVIHRVQTVFSRETTHAYPFGNQFKAETKQHKKEQQNISCLINPSYPANIGACAGEVLSANKGYLTIRADAKIGVRDLLQIFEKPNTPPFLLPVQSITVDRKNVFDIHKGQIATIKSDRIFPQGTRLFLLFSQNTHEIFTPKTQKKLPITTIPVYLKIFLHVQGIKITGKIKYFSFTKNYQIHFEEGISRRIDEKNVLNCISRLGNTSFVLSNVQTEISGNVFVPLSILNDVRRDYFKCLEEQWKKEKEFRKEKVRKWILDVSSEGIYREHPAMAKNTPYSNRKFSVKTDTLKYLEYLSSDIIDTIYLGLNLSGKDFAAFTSVFKNHDKNKPEKDTYRSTSVTIPDEIDISKKLVFLKDKIIFSLPAILRDNVSGQNTYKKTEKQVQTLLSLGFRKYQLSNPGAIKMFQGMGVQLYADYPLYCLNPLSALKLKKYGFCKYTLSPEDERDNMKTLLSKDAEIIVFQHTPLFISHACLWANMKEECPGRDRCDAKQMILRNEREDTFIAVNDECDTIVFNEKPFSIIHCIPEFLIEERIHFRIDLCYYTYSSHQIKELLSCLQNKDKISNSIPGNYSRGMQ